MQSHPYAKTIWDLLLADIGNEYGVSALMGNLRAESGLYPDRVQGDIPYSSYSQEYTAQVDSGAISKDDFIYNAPGGGGYGLAQWTYWSRKQALYEKWKNGGYTSIGNVYLACDYLLYELKNDFSSVYSALKNATSIRTPSDIVLHDFENPADQSESVEIARAEMGQEVYNAFSGSGSGDSATTAQEIIEKAIEWAVSVANTDTHGYDQSNRWSPDYDCSSFVITAFQYAGVPVKTNGATYTGDMVDVFVKCGFTKIGYVNGITALERGDVLWRDGHTEIYIGNNQNVGAHINELGTTTGGATGDQTGNEISVTSFSYSGTDWVYVLRLESVSGGGDTPSTPSRKWGRMKFLLMAMATDE